MLAVGLATLLAARYYLGEQDPELGKKVLAGGICLLLFGVGLWNWLSVRRELMRGRDDEK